MVFEVAGEPKRMRPMAGGRLRPESGHHRSFDDWFLNRLPPEHDDVIVDLGCGSAEFTASIADLVSDGRIIGIEQDPSMLEPARHHENPRLEFARLEMLAQRP